MTHASYSATSAPKPSAPVWQDETASAELPSGMRCKLTEQPLQKPVLAGDGYSYEPQAWQQHVAAHPLVLRSPVTHLPVAQQVRPNRHLQNIIDEWNVYQAARPPHVKPFDLERWLEDVITKEIMREPVVLPDGMVCEKETARSHIFRNNAHPGRSLLDERVYFTGAQQLQRDLNVLELCEYVLGESLPHHYHVPTIQSMLPAPAPAAAPAAPPAVAPMNVQAPVAAIVPPPAGAAAAAGGACCGVIGVGVFAAAGVAPFFLGIAAAKHGIFDGAVGHTAGRMIGVIMCILTPLWIGLLYALCCRGQRPAAAAPVPLPVGDNAV